MWYATFDGAGHKPGGDGILTNNVLFLASTPTGGAYDGVPWYVSVGIGERVFPPYYVPI